MKVYTGKQMHDADKASFEEYHISTLSLMENGAIAVTKIAKEYLDKKKLKNVLVICGKGNNGGDGFAVGRLLSDAGYRVKIIFVDNIENVKGDALINLNRAKEMDIFTSIFLNEIEDYIKEADIVIDAMLGTGMHGDVREPYNNVISKINQCSKYTISIDIPSGIDPDTGKVCGTAIRANETVSFMYPKIGDLTGEGSEYVGILHVEDIGIPCEIFDRIETDISYMDEENAKDQMPLRGVRTNKGTFGKVVTVAGNDNMVGAAYLAAKSAYKIGAGLVYVFTTKGACEKINILLPECITYDLDQHKDDIIFNAKTIILGPGLGVDENIRKYIKNILENAPGQIVLDADGLNNIADDPSILLRAKNKVIITPHIGEMARLSKTSIDDIKNRTMEIAKEFSKKYNCIVLLKDHRSIIAHPTGKIYINTTGSNALSKGGTGDVLAGIIGGLISQNMDSFNAAILGAYIHGLAGDIGGKKYTNYSLLAGELVDLIPEAIKVICKL